MLDKRRNGVTVNLTDSELEELDKKRGVMSRSAFVRECLIMVLDKMVR